MGQSVFNEFQRTLLDSVSKESDKEQESNHQGIRFAGKPLDRPRKETSENSEALKQKKAQRRKDYLQRIPIEGKFGQVKNGCRLNYIRAQRAYTSVAWINRIFLVISLAVLLRFFFTLWKCTAFIRLARLLPQSYGFTSRHQT